MPVLLVVALVIAVLWSPLAEAAADSLGGPLPDWLMPDNDPIDHATNAVFIVTMVFTLLIDGLINPTIEELYFRGYLLPRMPWSVGPSIVASPMLPAAQHFWPPNTWALIVVLQVILALAVGPHSKSAFGDRLSRRGECVRMDLGADHSDHVSHRVHASVPRICRSAQGPVQQADSEKGTWRMTTEQAAIGMRA